MSTIEATGKTIEDAVRSGLVRLVLLKRPMSRLYRLTSFRPNRKGKFSLKNRK